MNNSASDIWNSILGWLLGLSNVESIGDLKPEFAAPWVVGREFWLVVGAIALAVVALSFYLRYQTKGSVFYRGFLGVLRACLLVLLLLTLADPVLRITKTDRPPPLVYLLFDGSDSMNLEDRLTSDQRKKLASAVELDRADANDQPSRADYLSALLTRQEDNLVAGLQEKGYRLEAFVFEGDTTGRLRRLDLADEGDDDEPVDPAKLVESGQLAAEGQVTALGTALSDLRQQVGASKLASVVVFSDFDNNSGQIPVGAGQSTSTSPAKKLGVPIYAVGVGTTTAVNLAVSVQPPPKLKRGKVANMTVQLGQNALDGEMVNVRLYAKRLESEDTLTPEVAELIGEQTVELTNATQDVSIPFEPEAAGRYEIVAKVDGLEGETNTDDNQSIRKVRVIDDYLRLLYVSKEPTWEWRFIKEVFHRDPDVGMKGFRTYLASADINVCNTNELFLPTLSMERSAFFKHDVIILDDVPKSLLTDSFCNRVREFVSRFGGGLVIIAGPRFGPGQLVDTPLADMLPVTVDPHARIRDDREFKLVLTDEGRATDFMRLGDRKRKDWEIENEKAWDNLGLLNWYQPVTSIHSQAKVLAVHPTDTCADGRSPMPIIATRPFGSANGEVVYIGMNEMWRLRRRYGERYYRQYWSQLIHRLGLSHALGADKRFQPRTDRQAYYPESKVTFTVEASDENFEALSEEKVPGGKLTAELVYPKKPGEAQKVRMLELPMRRKGLFEVSFPVERAGQYRLRVKDPITGKFKEETFEVTAISPERRSIIRNVVLQEQLASDTGGNSYDLETASDLIKDMRLTSQSETNTRIQPLWTTPMWFILVVVLMLSEWLFRKMANLA